MIIVLGDVMIDDYVHVAVDRISPEAPVPVMRRLSSHSSPGGAANVGKNVEAMGHETTVIGSRRRVTRKTRYVAKNGQQIARLDEEDTHPLSQAEEDEVIAEVGDAMMRRPSALVISDYAKGVCSNAILREAIAEALRLAIPIIVDPKRRDWTSYVGATVITPNGEEWRMARVDRTSPLFPAILVTLGERGMELLEGNRITPIPSAAISVYDVTGAGDTVVAAMAVGLADGKTVEASARRAAIAASIVVGKRGTAVATKEEIDHRLTTGSNH